MAAALTEDLIEEVLLRIPPDDPASLVRAALVSKQWCRHICGGGFRRRFRAFHGGVPPLLGLICQRDDRTKSERFFIPVSSFRTHDRTNRRNMKAVHSSHGHVLLYSGSGYWSSGKMAQDLYVWNPILGCLRKLPRWPQYSYSLYTDCNAAVLCAGAEADGCDHIACHHGPFIVVFAATEYGRTFTCVYSSEADKWSDPVYVKHSYYCGFVKGNSVIVGCAVYFKCWFMSIHRFAILKYNLQTHGCSWIHIPSDGAIQNHLNQAVLMAMDGRLGFALTLFTLEGPKLYLWSILEHGPDENARWEQSIVMDLDKLLQAKVTRTHVVAFADNGAGGGVIFILSSDRLFSVDLKSWSSKVVGESPGIGRVVPYMSFCTPALGAVSIEEGEGPRANEPSA